MSRHRTAVDNLTIAIADAAAKATSEDVAQKLVAAGQLVFVVRSGVGEASTPQPLRAFAAELPGRVRAAAVTDIEEVDVAIELRPRERIGRCVAGDAVASRRMQIVDVMAKARIKTRWVHMWAEREFTRQWVIG